MSHDDHDYTVIVVLFGDDWYVAVVGGEEDEEEGHIQDQRYGYMI